MTNNDVLRRLRYTFDYTDDKMISFFQKANVKVTRAEVTDWLKSDDDKDFKKIDNLYLAAFLNGLIVSYRGRRDGKPPENETTLTNNDVLKKLKIVYSLKSEDIVELYRLAGKDVSQHELSSFLRRPTHPKYKDLMDQYLRNFLLGLQLTNKP
jgi:uncharacterized protein YehS (DUF1456 family)